MFMEEQRASGISREEVREYILDILQELAQLARSCGDSTSEEALTGCWQSIWRSDRS
jgi:hypothetical protein